MTDRHDIAKKQVLPRIADAISTVMKGQSRAIRMLLTAFISGGHVLIEDYPGTGKTTLAKALARCVGVTFKRIQFTPDLLPSDILGVSIFNQKDQSFHFHKGPLFTHILLADEINRASPRTQSALLEAMAENQVSIDGKVYNLESPFFVIATENPVEFHGTYPLPEAQMDRFAFQFSLGYVEPEEEVAILSDQQTRHPLDNVTECITMQDLLDLKSQAKEIRISDELKRYIVDLVRQTRNAEAIQLGASPRASLSLMKAAQALALFDGYDFVTPEHIRELAVSVIAHRLVLPPHARFSGVTSQRVIEDIIKTLPVPV